MRTVRLTSALAAAALATLAFGCSRCGQAPPPPERYAAAEAAFLVSAPSLAALAGQVGEVLATVATFPGGQAALELKAVLPVRLGFDPLDPKALAGAGLDPARGAALWMIPGQAGAEPALVVALPVGDAAALEATVARIAKDRMGTGERLAIPGSPEVIGYKPAGYPGAYLFCYLITGKTLLLSGGQQGAEAVRAAAAVKPAASLEAAPGFRKAVAALGPGRALVAWVDPQRALAGLPVPPGTLAQLKEPIAFGLSGGRDRLALATAMLPGDRAADLEAAATGAASRPLLAKLDAGAFLAFRGDAAFSLLLAQVEAQPELGSADLPPEARRILKEVLASLGGGVAGGLGLLPPAGRLEARPSEAPLRFLRAEALLSLKDPARMAGAIDAALAAAGEGKLKLPKGGPWKVPGPGGEVGAAIDGQVLLVAAGPPGALEALRQRTGAGVKGPTAASDAALRGGAGGLVLDVPRAAAAVAAFPEEAFGEGVDGVMAKSMVTTWSASLARILAVSVSGGFAGGVQVGELLVEVKPQEAAR